MRRNVQRIKLVNAIQLFGALFETMKDAHDGRYISRKHEKNIIFIPSNGVLTTEFSLTEEKKQLLMQQGRDHAKKFLTTWNLIKIYSRLVRCNKKSADTPHLSAD